MNYSQRLDMYRQRIKTLEDAYNLIQKRIENNEVDDLKKLMEEKSIIQRELSELRRKQWEEDHERVNFDDDH